MFKHTPERTQRVSEGSFLEQKVSILEETCRQLKSLESRRGNLPPNFTPR